MILNRYEFTEITNSDLPGEWQSQTSLEEFREFLQQNWDQRSVFYNDDDKEKKQQFIEFIGSGSVRTKKYIGTIVFKGEQLNIFPRVFKECPSDYAADNLTTKYLMSNLVKWIEYCNKLNYPYLNISSELNDSEDLKELFITLYINYVRLAIERGVYFRYVDETEDCSSIKGKFDIKDYFLRKIPNGQTASFRCTYSKFEFDNQVNRIIKYTCKQLYKITTQKNQRKLRLILSRLDEVLDVPCSPHDCDGIRLGNMNKNYAIIISMSKMFLMNKMSGYSIDTNETFCFLFPTDLLFEGFIGGFMKEVLGEHGAKVRLQESKSRLVERIVYNGVETGAAFTMRHDILVEYLGKLIILDTKYKEVSRFDGNPKYAERISEEVKQQDLYQMVTYAWKRGAKDVFLLYPMYRNEDIEPDFPYAICESPTGNITIHFIRLPFVFEADENRTEQKLTNIIKQIFEIV